MDLEAVKNYLRIDGDAEDAALEAMVAAADTYIKDTTGKHYVLNNEGAKPIEEDALFQMCLKMLVAQWYENRGEQVQGNVTSVKYAVSEMLQHIQYCSVYLEDVSESDTSDPDVMEESHEDSEP